MVKQNQKIIDGLVELDAEGNEVEAKAVVE